MATKMFFENVNMSESMPFTAYLFIYIETPLIIAVDNTNIKESLFSITFQNIMGLLSFAETIKTK